MNDDGSIDVVNEYSLKSLWQITTDYYYINRFYSPITGEHIIRRVNDYHIYIGGNDTSTNTAAKLVLNPLGFYDHMEYQTGDLVAPRSIVSSLFSTSNIISYMSINHMELILDETVLNSIVEKISFLSA